MKQVIGVLQCEGSADFPEKVDRRSTSGAVQ